MLVARGGGAYVIKKPRNHQIPIDKKCAKWITLYLQLHVVLLGGTILLFFATCCSPAYHDGYVYFLEYSKMPPLHHHGLPDQRVQGKGPCGGSIRDGFRLWWKPASASFRPSASHYSSMRSLPVPTGAVLCDLRSLHVVYGKEANEGEERDRKVGVSGAAAYA